MNPKSDTIPKATPGVTWPEMARLLRGDRVPEWCSFCMQHAERKDLVAAANVRICRPCVAVCEGILKEQANHAGGSREPTEAEGGR